jgi:DNA-directed RNA polymerase
MDDNTIAIRLMVAGISVAEGGDLGTNKDGEKNLLDQALFIGRNLGHQRVLGLKVGAWGINMLTDLPAFALDAGVLKMTAPVDEIMDDVIVNAVKNNPLLSPLTTPPEPWTQVRKGGLPADHWAKVPLICERNPKIENAVCNAIGRGRMQPVLDAINVLQRVAFTINEPVLDFVKRDGGPPAPEEPQPPIWQQKEWQNWIEVRARRKVFDTDMVVADAMAGAGCFWVPLNIDFRGRIYGIPHFNFQREDRVRALFLFADGEPIGEEGLRWLKAHVAGTANGNAWSDIKKPGALGHYDRIKWTDANLEKLCDIGRAVIRRDDPATIAWALPKKPYQFLAACVELAQAIEKGPDFKTRLPLMFDGSCSGLQHLCAMTRADEGEYVNLTAAFEPDDFYTRVANRVWEAAPELRHLMQGESDRDIVKQPAMSYFYGSRPGGWQKLKNGRWRAYGMTRQIIDVLKERRKNSTEGAKELARTIYGVIGDMVPRAKAVRDFLEELTKLCAQEGKPLRWTWPAGLPVINCYHKPDGTRIEVLLNGRRRTFDFVVGDKDDIDGKTATNSVTANFVHSLDAAHLQAVAIEAARAGIETVCVHDCFGCVAPRAWRLKEAIHVKFVQLHRHDLLAGVLASARAILPKNTKLPSLPQAGTLKLEDMYLNYHAFKNN